MTRAALVLAAAASLGPGCGFAVADISTVPDKPAWDADVKPYLADHCLVCHGDHARRGAEDFFRLDVFSLIDPLDHDQELGACEMRVGILERAVVRETMPPVWLGERLGPNGRELLRRWIQQLPLVQPCGY